MALSPTRCTGCCHGSCPRSVSLCPTTPKIMAAGGGVGKDGVLALPGGGGLHSRHTSFQRSALSLGRRFLPSLARLSLPPAFPFLLCPLKALTFASLSNFHSSIKGPKLPSKRPHSSAFPEKKRKRLPQELPSAPHAPEPPQEKCENGGTGWVGRRKQ